MSELFVGTHLRGGFIIAGLNFVSSPIQDPMGRSAIAKTQIIGKKLHLTLLSGLEADENSVSIYHEILEAMTVASPAPPSTVHHFIEADFERAAYESHSQFGPASPESLNRMLQFYGFQEE